MIKIICLGVSTISNENFYTFSEYIKNDGNLITPSMEDYIEMIYRLSIDNKMGIRVNDLSEALNVRPPSTTKMMKRLLELNICEYKKHGAIFLTDNGLNIGRFLLLRHNTIEAFLRYLGVRETLLDQTEKIEHLINSETLECINKFLLNYSNNENK